MFYELSEYIIFHNVFFRVDWSFKLIHEIFSSICSRNKFSNRYAFPKDKQGRFSKIMCIIRIQPLCVWSMLNFDFCLPDCIRNKNLSSVFSRFACSCACHCACRMCWIVVWGDTKIWPWHSQNASEEPTVNCQRGVRHKAVCVWKTLQLLMCVDDKIAGVT